MSTAYTCRSCGKEGAEHFYASAKYQCKECWNSRTAKTQKDKIVMLKESYGGKCTVCGYDKSLNALEFHHTDPSEKEFNLGARRGLKEETLRKELDKCVLVCRNCHAEIHEEWEKQK